MKKFIERIGMETLVGGICGVIAVIAAIVSTILGGIDSASVWGCVKDVAGTLAVVVVLFMMIKATKTKEPTGFDVEFDKKMDEIILRYKPIVTKDADRDFYNLSRDIGALFTQSPTSPVRFLEVDRENSSFKFLIRQKHFGTDVGEVAEQIFHKLDCAYGDNAKVRIEKKECNRDIIMEFNNKFNSIEQADFAAEVISLVIFYYIAEYRQ